MLWEEIAPSGPDQQRRVGAALIDRRGQVIAGPKIILDGGALPNHILTVWNGTAFTVVVCNSEWDEDPKLVWGELSADGTFTRRGERVFGDGTDLRCTAPVVSAGTVSVQATTVDETWNEDDVRTSRGCATHRITIDRDRAHMGKPARLCEVHAANSAWVVGTDRRNRFAFVGANGATVSTTRLFWNRFAADGHGFVGITSGDRGGVVSTSLMPPFKRFTNTTAFERGPLGANQVGELLPTPSHRLTLHAGTPHGDVVAIYDNDGKLVWDGVFAADSYAPQSRCAPGARSLLCVWTDDDEASEQGEVRAVLFPLPPARAATSPPRP